MAAIGMGNPNRVADGRRTCVKADGQPKRVHASIEAAEDFIERSHRPGQYHAYTCRQCGGVHVGHIKRRMIFPTAQTPCGTPGCAVDTPHTPNECGRPA